MNVPKLYFLVTVKLPHDPRHNPRNKVAGACPISHAYCSDTTGEHHTVIVRANSPEQVLHTFTDDDIHVTRIEQVPLGTI